MKYIVLILFVAICTVGWGQKSQARSELRGGNKQYKKESYEQAQTRYHKALSVDSTYGAAHYNLGNSLYRQKNYDEATKSFASALQQDNLSDKQRSMAWHNKGNCHLQQGIAADQPDMEQLQQAVNCYQEALKLNPKNDDTRYNLSYAKKLLARAQQQNKNNQNQQQNQQGQGQNQQQNQKDKQDQKDKNQQGQGQNQQQQEQKDKKQGEQNPQQMQKKEQQKKDAERMLEAMKNNEKKTMKNQQKVVGTAVRTDKDW